MPGNLLPAPEQDTTPRFYYQSQNLGQVPISQQQFSNISSMASPTMLPVGYFDLLAQGYTMDESGDLHSPQIQNVNLGASSPMFPGMPFPSSSVPAAAQPAPAVNPSSPSGYLGPASQGTSPQQSSPLQSMIQSILSGSQYSPPSFNRLSNAGSSSGQAEQQPSALMQNFPTFRKKSAQTPSSPIGPGQYNENFWNAWRL